MFLVRDTRVFSCGHATLWVGSQFQGLKLIVHISAKWCDVSNGSWWIFKIPIPSKFTYHLPRQKCQNMLFFNTAFQLFFCPFILADRICHLAQRIWAAIIGTGIYLKWNRNMSTAFRGSGSFPLFPCSEHERFISGSCSDPIGSDPTDRFYQVKLRSIFFRALMTLSVETDMFVWRDSEREIIWYQTASTLIEQIFWYLNPNWLNQTSAAELRKTNISKTMIRDRAVRKPFPFDSLPNLLG